MDSPHDELEEYFHLGCKPAADWKIGVEYETPVVDGVTGESVAYEGERGIGRLLGEMLERYRWEGVYEGDTLIALRDGKSSITLEPGGQFEMSGQQCDTLHCAHDELQQHVEEILAVGDDLDLVFLGLGLVPKTPVDRVPWMPKARYRIMREVMETTGRLGHRMMKQTATVQSNFDYESEADAVRKVRVSMAMAPLLVAVSANSPVADGKPTGYRSYRAHIWSDTDSSRCGFLPFVFETDNLFGAYTHYALDVPMYFISRGDTLHSSAGKTFRQFLQEGHEGKRASAEDWALHLTTLFPEVRLKTYIELRSADCQPPELMLSTPALMKGLLYDSDCLDAAWDELKRWPLAELPRLQEEAAREGLRGRVAGHSFQDFALEMYSIAREGLVRQDRHNRLGERETIYLEPLEAALREGRSPADTIVEAWEGQWQGNIDRLIDYGAYRP